MPVQNYIIYYIYYIQLKKISFRLCNLTVFGIIRAPVEDLVFRGYTIPASALVVPDFDSVFMDPEIWTDPEVFRPDRFINEQGKLENKEEFLGFFTGEITLSSTYVLIHIVIYCRLTFRIGT